MCNINFLNLAARIAQKLENKHRYYLAAILTDKNKPISVGVNKKQTHPSSNHPRGYLHAEVDAIRGAYEKELRGSTLYLSRVSHRGRTKISLSKPCKFCQAAIKNSGIKNVYYTIDQCHIGWWNVKRNEWSVVACELKPLRDERHSV